MNGYQTSLDRYPFCSVFSLFPQIDAMQKVLSEAGFADQLSLVAHSPLVRAKETCFGILDLSSSSGPSVVELH